VIICTNAPLVLLEHLKKHNGQVGVAAPVTPTMSKWWSTARALCSARRRRADDCGRPSPRRRQEAPQSGGVKPLRSSPKGAEPRAAGSSPASMASGVDRIAAPWGSPKAESAPFPAVLPNQRGGAAPLHRHGIQRHYVDSHGQSEVAVAFWQGRVWHW
jgi:hypothetical protein